MKELDLTKIQEYLEQSADFVAEQAPLVAQEILFIGRLQYTLGAAASFMVLAAAVTVLFVCLRRGSKGFNYVDSDEIPCIIGIMLSGMGTLSFGCFFVQSSVFAMTAWFAPRVYILEQLKGIL